MRARAKRSIRMIKSNLTNEVGCTAVGTAAIFWSTNKLLQKTDLTLALQTFKNDLPHYWDNSDDRLKKEPEEIEEFLDFLLDHGYQTFDDLSPPQQRLVQFIRHKHADGIRKVLRAKAEATTNATVRLTVKEQLKVMARATDLLKGSLTSIGATIVDIDVPLHRQYLHFAVEFEGIKYQVMVARASKGGLGLR